MLLAIVKPKPKTNCIRKECISVPFQALVHKDICKTVPLTNVPILAEANQ